MNCQERKNKFQLYIQKFQLEINKFNLIVFFFFKDCGSNIIKLIQKYGLGLNII